MAAYRRKMALAMEEDVALDPVDVRLFGPTAVVACANRVTDTVEELRLRRSGRGSCAKDRGGRRALSGETYRTDRIAAVASIAVLRWADDSPRSTQTASTNV
jgi:hypothetical protein